MNTEILNLTEKQAQELRERFAQAMKGQKESETKEKVLKVDWLDDSVQYVTK